MIIGECKERSAPAILDYVNQQSLLPAEVNLIGCVERDLLAGYCKGATALLMPLWKDDASITRLPNKMGEYLATGRPVITSEIGDLTEFLIDNVNAYVGEPGNERAFADKMIEVLEDPERAERIGAAGQEMCFARLDYRSQSEGLSNFVVRCIESRNRRRSSGKDSRPLRPPSMAPMQVEATAKECSAEGNPN